MVQSSPQKSKNGTVKRRKVENPQNHSPRSPKTVQPGAVEVQFGAMLWKCQAGYAGGVGQSGFRRGALATWDSRNSFLRRCCGNAGQRALATWGRSRFRRGALATWVSRNSFLRRCCGNARAVGSPQVTCRPDSGGRTGNVGQSKFISEAMLWKCRTAYAGGVGQSRFRRGALATWSVEIQF